MLMRREDLYYVLFDQQRGFQQEDAFVHRELIPQVISLLRLRLPIVITGVRRAGKSTFLKLVRKELQLQEKGWLYVNFNDERLLHFSVEDFQKILDFLQEQGYSEQCYLLIDEIQEVDHWEKWVDRIKEKHPILVTGSNSKLLSKEISTVLTGRSISKSLYPFSFREFLVAKQVDILQWATDLSLQARIRKKFSEYLTNGGVPLSMADGEGSVLPELYENIIYRDIVKRFNKNLEKPVKEISLYLLSNISRGASLRSFSTISGITNLSTVKSVIDSFENAFLFFFISKFDFSVKKQLFNPRKVYCIDTGFVTRIGFRFSEDKGRILENIVFLELKRREKDIYYFSDKRECDFVVRQGARITEAIQVCQELNQENESREIGGLLGAMEKFKLNEGLILTYGQMETRKINNKKINIVPVWRWLLPAIHPNIHA